MFGRMRSCVACGGVLLGAVGLAGGAAVTMSVEEIRPGMRGTVMTVLQGTAIVPVETEIFGVQENGLGPGKHLIIGKLVDEKTRLTGAVHGMSGSPLYIDGRLAGALSRRVAFFEKDGHCGFTPIGDMLETERYLADGGGRVAAARPQLREGLRGEGISSEWLAIPFQISGASERALGLIGRLWEGSGLLLAGGGGGRGSDKPGGELVPGAAVSAAMAVGDITMAGTGTLTWREGDKVLAFGHPMMNLGGVRMPMCEAEIITTIPSYERPYKLANLRRAAGTVVEDRFSAIAGIVGPKPALPEYRIRVRFDDHEPVEYRGQFVAHERMTPLVASTLLLNSLVSSEHVGEELTVRIAGELRLRGHPAVRMDGFSSGDTGALLGGVMDLRSRMQRVFEQPFEEVVPEGFDVEASVAQRREQARIESLSLWPRGARAGEEVRAEVRLQRRWGGEQRVEFRFAVPQEARVGETLTIEANDEGSFLDRDAGGPGGPRDAGRGLIVLSSPRRDEAAPRSLDELIGRLNRIGRADVLMLRVTRAQEGFRDGGGRSEDVPASVAAVFRNGVEPVEAVGEAAVAEMREAVGSELEGSATARLTVR